MSKLVGPEHSASGGQDRYIDFSKLTDSSPRTLDQLPPWDDLHIVVVGEGEMFALARGFEDAGVLHVEKARTGLEALRMLETDPSLNFFVTAFEVPELDGLGLLHALSKLPSPVACALYGSRESLLQSCSELVFHKHQGRFLGILPAPADKEELTKSLGRAREALAREQAKLPESMPLDEIVRGIEASEFEPFFQPKIRLSDGAVVGAEALARWRHPNAGLIPPVRFIEVLEASGKMGSLTSQMLTMSLAHAKSWRSMAPNVGVSVNLSLSFLATHGSSKAISSAAKAAGLPPEAVVLEVTELVAMSNAGECAANLARLRMRGFQLAADDFGVGHSSLELLMRVPFQEVKLDREFVTRAKPGSREAAVLEALVPLTRALSVRTVAEGVESRKEWEHLRAIGCDAAQGYWMAKPMDAKAFHAWIAGLAPKSNV